MKNKNEKIKNEFEGKRKKTKKPPKIGRGRKKSYTQRVKERMGEYYEEKPFKIHEKEKKDKYGDISNFIEKNNENVIRKKPTKAQIMTAKSSKAKATIIRLRQRKKLCKQKMAENNSKLLLSEIVDFDPE